MKNLKKLVLFLAVGMILSSSLFAAFSPLLGKAAANATPPDDPGGGSAPYETDTIPNQVEAYVMTRAIGKCIKTADLHDNIDHTIHVHDYKRVEVNNAQQFKWFFGGSFPTATDTDTYTGYLDDNGDGKDSCHDNGMVKDMTDAYRIYNFGGSSDGITAICYSGFTREGNHNSESPDDCGHGDGRFVRPNDDKTAAANKFKANVLGDYYGLPGGSLPAMSEPMRWYFYYHTLQHVCHATKSEDSIDQWTQEQLSQPNIVTMVGGDGTTTEVWQLGKDLEGNQLTKNGPKVDILTADNFSDKISESCGDIAQNATLTAADYAAAVSADPDSAGSSTDGSTNGNPTCESTSGDFGWLICKMIDGMQSLVGGMYDKIVFPLLTTSPLSTDTSSDNGTYAAWKEFRVYGDVFLVIALLIIVFGESIGGGIIDAYTAKKVLPRLLIAAILINLSFYLVALLLDAMNILGKGVMTLITAPFGLSGDFSIDIGVGSGTGLVAILTFIIIHAWTSASGQFMSWFIFIILLPIVLIVTSIVATVLVRRALIVFLVIISPLAFALYCLPNTEKYFRQWWDILFKTLLVYPIIAALFAMGKVSSVLLSQAGGNWLTGTLGQVLSVAALFVPLALIPFSFRIAGGVLGRAFEAVEGMRARGHKFTEGTRQRIQTQAGKNRLEARGKAYNAIQRQADKGGNTTAGNLRRQTLGRALKGVNALVGGYNVEAALSAARADTMKTMNDQIATGADSEIRGLTVNKKWALTQREGTEWRMENGRRQFKSLGGEWINEADVDKGHARWGKDTFAQQAATAYEMRKINTEEQSEHFDSTYRVVAQGIDASGNKVGGGWQSTGSLPGQSLNDYEAGGIHIGAAFEHQNLHLDKKSTDWKTGQLKVTAGTSKGRDGRNVVVEDSGLRGGSLATEAYEKKGNSALSGMSSEVIVKLMDAWDSADRVTRGVADDNTTHVTYDAATVNAAEVQKEQLAAVAEVFMSRYGAVAGAGGGIDDNALREQIQREMQQEALTELQQQGVTPTSPEGQARLLRAREQANHTANSYGAGHVGERVVEFAQLTGRYAAIPRTPDSDDPGSPAIPPQN